MPVWPTMTLAAPGMSWITVTPCAPTNFTAKLFMMSPFVFLSSV
jgi:hypothetical protein